MSSIEEDGMSSAAASVSQEHGFVPKEMFVEDAPTPSETFFRLVEESLGIHAARKGYSENGPDGENVLYQFTTSIGAASGHAIGEIIYKATEYMKDPREVLLIKICGWALLEWRYGKYSK
jgi:hypothetical protein